MSNTGKGTGHPQQLPSVQSVNSRPACQIQVKALGTHSNCRCCYFQMPSVVHCMNATASAQSPNFVWNFYPQTIFAKFCG